VWVIRHVSPSEHLARQESVVRDDRYENVFVRGYRDRHVLPVEGVKVIVTGVVGGVTEVLWWLSWFSFAVSPKPLNWFNWDITSERAESFLSIVDFGVGVGVKSELIVQDWVAIFSCDVKI